MLNKKILLADDDELFASLLIFRLKKAGFQVTHVTDGKQAKEHLVDNLPDIVVFDIMMPYFSGIELIDHVRNEVKSNIPIIIVSSAGNEENVLNALEMGANDFMSKPVSPSELLVRVTRELKKM